MQPNGYYEVYASIFDTIEEVTFYPYESKVELLEPIKDVWGVERLQWFTKGLYSVTQQDDAVILSDLRMGVQCSYVFNFKVGQLKKGNVEVGDFEKLTLRPDVSGLSAIWNRIWDPQVSMAPSKQLCKDNGF